MKSLLALIIVFSACGDNSSAVELSVLGTPDLLKYRSNLDEWETPSLISIQEGINIYSLNIVSDFEIVLVCTRADGSFSVQELVGKYDDIDTMLNSRFNTWPVQACAKSAGPVIPIELTGQMVQSGEVVVDSLRESGSGLWDFSFSTFPGPKDLVAIGDDRMLIRHDQIVTDSLIEQNINVDAEGSAVTSVLVPVSGADVDEQLLGSTVLTTKNLTTLSRTAIAPEFEIEPLSQLVQGDSQSLSVGTVSQLDPQSSRGAWFQVDESMPSSVVLLPRLADVSFDSSGVGVSCNNLPSTYTSLDVSYDDEMANGGIDLTVTKRWIDEHGATAVSLDSSAPGYESQWSLSSSTTTHTLIVDDVDSTLWRSTTITDAQQLNAQPTVGVGASGSRYIQVVQRRMGVALRSQP